MTKVPALVLTLTMPLVYTAIFIAGYVYVFAPWIRSEKFDSKTWKHEERKRYTMVKDVIETKLLIGKTREEVIAFLGEDFENGPCGDCIGYSTYDPDQPGFLDHDVLEIDFHEKRVDTVFTNAW